MSQSLEQTIRQTYEHLPESERKIADVLLEMGGELAAYSATELAGRAGVSKATATRLVRRLGFSDFHHLRQEARASRTGSPLAELDGTAAPGSLGRHLELDLDCLSRTLTATPADYVARAVAILGAAARVWVIGLRNSYALALYARELLVQVKPDVRLLPVAGQTLAEDLSAMEPGDAVLMLGFRRRPPLMTKMLRAVKTCGADVVLLCDASFGDAAADASVTFPCVIRGASLFDSYVAPLSLVNHLCAEVALTLGETAQARLRRSEELHDALGDLGF